MQEYKVKELLTIRNGRDHKQLANGKFPVYGSGGIMRYVDSYLYDKPSILLPRKGTLNNIQYCEEPFWCVDTTYYSEINQSLANPYYLYRYLSLLNLKGLDSGSVLPSMTFDSYYQIKVFLPSIEVQNLVGKLLYDIDQKISHNTRINAELEAMAKQLYDYWFVQFDFPDGNGKPYKSSGGKMVWNEKLKRYIPEGWEDVVMSDIASITMGQSPDGASYNEDGDGMIFYQGSTDFGIRFPSVRMFSTNPTRFAKKGDILMSVRAPVGDTNIANTDCCIGRGLAALNSKIGSISHLYFIIRDLKARFDILNSMGTTFGAITKDELFSLPVVCPKENVLTEYERKCAPIFEKQMVIGREIDELTNLRNSILPMLMNGQVTIE